MNNTKEIIKRYIEKFPKDKEKLQNLKKHIKNNKDLFNRKNFFGHIVANSLIINNNNETLVLYHNFLQMYLQPGGHIDQEDDSVIKAAKREILEETSIKDAVLENWHKKNNFIPIFIEEHKIPENKKKKEKDHLHFDFMYIFKIDKTDIVLQQNEVSDFKWVKIEKILEEKKDSFVKESLKRAREFGII